MVKKKVVVKKDPPKKKKTKIVVKKSTPPSIKAKRASTKVKKAVNVVKNKNATNKANQDTVKDNSYKAQNTSPFAYMIKRKNRAEAKDAVKKRTSKPLPKNPHSKASKRKKK